MIGRNVVIQGLVSLLLFPLVSAAGQNNAAPSGDFATMGHQFYATYCSSCHGPGGKGDGPVAPVLRTAPADLTQISKRHGGQFPIAEISAFIDGRVDVEAHGNREMPVWGERFGEKVGGGTIGEEVVRGNLLILVEYLQSIQQ